MFLLVAVDLAGLYSNPLKRITSFKRSHPNNSLSEVDASGAASSDINSVSRFRKNSKYGDQEVTRHKQKQKILSDKEKLEIIARYQKGESTYTLAKAYGCHRSTISNNLKKSGIKVDEHKIDDEEAIRLYQSGLTIAEVAKRLNTCPSVISRTLKKNNIPSRSSWESRNIKNGHK